MECTSCNPFTSMTLNSDTKSTSSVIQTPTVFQILTPLAWTTFIFLFLSTCLSLYLVFIKVKINFNRWKSKDRHYQLRLVLSLVLLFGRICQLLAHVVYIQLQTLNKVYSSNIQCKLGNGQCQKPFEVSRTQIEYFLHIYEVSNMLWQTLLYPSIFLLLVITMDRYIRVMMVLPGSRLYRFFKCVVVVSAINTLFIMAGYLAQGSHYIIGYDKLWRQGYLYNYSMFLIAKKLVELVSLIIGIPLEYYLTVTLFWSCVRHHLKRPANLSVENSNNRLIVYLWKKMSLLRKQQLKVVIQMSGLFFAIFLMDVGISSLIIATQGFGVLNFVLTDYDWIQMAGFVGSWVVIRIALTFELLDLFLKQFKESQHVEMTTLSVTNSFQRSSRPMDACLGNQVSFDRTEQFTSYQASQGKSFSPTPTSNYNKE